MQKLISEIFEIIKDYRESENLMSEERIQIWINQFDEEDQIFVLEEMKFLLSKRYFSKENVKRGLEKIILDISSKYDFAKPSDFLAVSNFINQQPAGKSQSELLKLLFEISKEKFDFDIQNSIVDKPKYFIYLDDIFCTGDSLFKGLIKQDYENEIVGGWLFEKIEDISHLDYLKTNDAKLLILNFINHDQHYSKFTSRLYYALGKQNIDQYYTFWAFLWIENKFKSPTSKLDFLFPQKKDQPENVLTYFQNLEVDEEGVFRKEERPLEETFFSNAENRNRFENIILKKSLYLYEQAGTGRSTRMRPLGYGLASHKNLGFGTFAFTYRNVPFNTPLVFWYSSHNWTPLFERFFSTYN